MKLIKEHINFERGKNPLDSMDIGKKKEIWYRMGRKNRRCRRIM